MSDDEHLIDNTRKTVGNIDKNKSKYNSQLTRNLKSLLKKQRRTPSDPVFWTSDVDDFIVTNQTGKILNSRDNQAIGADIIDYLGLMQEDFFLYIKKIISSLTATEVFAISEYEDTTRPVKMEISNDGMNRYTMKIRYGTRIRRNGNQ